jgi:hypothetical protein
MKRLPSGGGRVQYLVDRFGNIYYVITHLLRFAENVVIVNSSQV